MRTIDTVKPDAHFFECVQTLMQSFGLDRVMLTGGEPTIHSQLKELLRGICSTHISVTTNGIRPMPIQEWRSLKRAGLSQVIVSMHDASPQQFLKLETRTHGFGWAARALESQKGNLAAASEAGLQVRVNTVVYHSVEHALAVLDSLKELQCKHQFEIRLLNDLANVESSQRNIRSICQILGAKEVEMSRRAGSSNATVSWQTDSGFRFSTKTAFRYYLETICAGCPVKEYCHEGFYGIRLEQRLGEPWVRLCIYKHIPEVLMPWKKFLASESAKKLRDMLAFEQR